MADTPQPKSWWITLPGLLTQLVALVTALTGLVAALYQSGMIGSRDTASAPASKAAPSPAPIATQAPAPVVETGRSAAGTLSPPAASPASAPKGAIPIRIGDTLSDGVPAPGAGRIESPGAEDVYRFDAAVNQRVYFRMREHGASMDQIKWRLTGPDEQTLFDTCLACGDPGVQTLARGGTYTLNVGNPTNPATGTYALRLTDVPAANRFALRLPAHIAPGQPGRGAGMIDVPGAADEYVFNAAPNQRVYFHMREHGANMSQIKWRLTDQDGQALFDTCLGCGDPGTQTLTRGGTYILTVGNPSNAATGTYRLGLTLP